MSLVFPMDDFFDMKDTEYRIVGSTVKTGYLDTPTNPSASGSIYFNGENRLVIRLRFGFNDFK